MTTMIIIMGMLMVFAIGFVRVYTRHSRVMQKIDFADEYRDNFIKYSNDYNETYDPYSKTAKFEGNGYIWLMTNANKIQLNLGLFGLVSYLAPGQTYKVSNYAVVINTIPKFRDGSVKDFDANLVDDCILRYIGYLEESSLETSENLRNPFIWFREGFRGILSFPVFILNWFGLINIGTVNSINNSSVYKIMSGLSSLVTLISGIVTIFVGYDQTVEFLKRLLGK